MRSERQIYIDFNSAEEQVQKLNRAADLLYELADDLTRSLNQVIRQNWSGQNAYLYIEQEQKVIDKVRREADNTRNLATTTKQIANNLKNSELRAVRIAKQRAEEQRRRSQ